MTKDAVNTVDGYVFSPIRRMLSDSYPEEDEKKPKTPTEEEIIGGFEIIALSPMRNMTTDLHIVHVEDLAEYQVDSVGIRTTISWTY